jgi:hypothetical protein
MTFRGQFKNGVVVFRKRPRLKEGAEVVVSSAAGPAPRKGGRARKRLAFRPVGTWDGPPGELERLLGEVQQMREADLAAERAREHGSIPA